ncbi:uncharacterized protein LOC123475660 [Daphnia magna]|uniref:uncharacterized protein LOC123475660 n=1 Tax=Daphnia magna TaxID=35525 RepID=UPI001E1BABDB|nr:uncharacterized protein LOC123475660 [Daphnia magna]
MPLCKIMIKGTGQTGIFNEETLLDLKNKISQRFLAPVDLLELHSDGFPVVCDDDFLCLSIVAGPLTFTVTILEGRERYNDHRGLPDLGNELDPEPSTSETGIDISLEDYYPIRDIIRENGWDKSRVDALLCRLDAEDAELSKKDRSAINIAVGKWLYKHKGMNGMPKPAEFDLAAKSIVAHFPIAKDASCTPDNIIHSSWYDVNTNVGRLSNYVRDRRSNNKNKGAIVRSYNKRQTENFEDEFDITLQDQERFMRENQVTAENKEKMMQCHFGTLESRRKWILEKKPTVTDILTRFPRFTSLKGALIVT